MVFSGSKMTFLTHYAKEKMYFYVYPCDELVMGL